MAALPHPRPPSPVARRTRWHNWVRLPGAPAIAHGDADGVEIPLDRVVMPGEVLATVVHHGLEKSWPDPRADLGALAAALHDILDLGRVYRRGMQVDAWHSYANRGVKWLWQAVEELPPEPTAADHRRLGDRLIDIADLLDLPAIFGT